MTFDMNLYNEVNHLLLLFKNHPVISSKYLKLASETSSLQEKVGITIHEKNQRITILYPSVHVNDGRLSFWQMNEINYGFENSDDLFNQTKILMELALKFLDLISLPEEYKKKIPMTNNVWVYF